MFRSYSRPSSGCLKRILVKYTINVQSVKGETTKPHGVVVIIIVLQQEILMILITSSSLFYMLLVFYETL
jgi:hypothetical protein